MLLVANLPRLDERGPQVEAIVCLLVLNGLRVSEVCVANVEDLRREPDGGYSLVVALRTMV